MPYDSGCSIRLKLYRQDTLFFIFLGLSYILGWSKDQCPGIDHREKSRCEKEIKMRQVKKSADSVTPFNHPSALIGYPPRIYAPLPSGGWLCRNAVHTLCTYLVFRLSCIIVSLPRRVQKETCQRKHASDATCLASSGIGVMPGHPRGRSCSRPLDKPAINKRNSKLALTYFLAVAMLG